MTEQGFWALIDVAREMGGGDVDEELGLVVHRLEHSPAQDVADFQRHLLRALDRAYDWGLWGAAVITLGECDEDDFEFFRVWLVSQGKEVFERALADPDSLAEHPEGGGMLEDLLYLAEDVYESLTGEELPAPDLGPRPQAPRGTPWEEEDLPGRFPRLADRFGS
jgi:hypothetical protein